MGLFGGGNSSKSTTNNYDQRQNQAAGKGVAGNNNYVVNETSDYGAIENAFEFGESAIDGMAESQEMALEFAGGSMSRVLDSLDDNTGQAFGIVESVFERAIDSSDAARAESFGAISQNNKRMDEIYSTVGRETQDQTMKIVMLMAGLVGASLLVGVARA